MRCFLIALALGSLQSIGYSAISWSSPAAITSVGMNADQPKVSVDAVGNSVAVWRITSGSTTVIQASTLPFKGTWSDAVTLSDSACTSFSPEIAVDSSGNAIALWQCSDGIYTMVQAAYLPFKGKWSWSQSLLSIAWGSRWSGYVGHSHRGL